MNFTFAPPLGATAFRAILCCKDLVIPYALIGKGERSGPGKVLWPLALLLSVLNLSACSKTKTVVWEEEVRLNTGGIIWVKRSDEFKQGSEPGNPLRSSWWPATRTYEFDWKGRHHVYRTTPKESQGALLLHMTFDGIPIVVDATRSCAKPGYAEFRWQGEGWQLQPNVSPDLLDQPRNLMAYYAADGSIPSRLSTQSKIAEDSAPHRARVPLKLDSSNVAINCSERK